MTKPNAEAAASFFAVYEEYARTLRAWFIALGAGGPAFLVGQPQIAASVKASGNLGLAVFLFIVGVVLQVLLMFLNKSVAWINYSAVEPTLKKRPNPKLIKFADRVSEKYWIDIVVDLCTASVFIWAVKLIAFGALAL